MPPNNRFAGVHTIAELDAIESEMDRKNRWNVPFQLSKTLDGELQWISRRIGISRPLRRQIHSTLRKLSPETYRTQFEIQERRFFLERLHHLGITEEVLRQVQRVVDVGAGVRDFAGHSMRIGLPTEIASVDPHADNDNEYWEELSPAEREAIEALTLREHIENAPLEKGSADLVIAHDLHFSHGGCHDRPNKPNMIKGVAEMRAHAKTMLESTFEAMTRLIKDEGQVRIYPFDPANDGPVLDALESIEKTGGYQVGFEEVPPLERRHGDTHYHHDPSSYRIVIQR